MFLGYVCYICKNHRKGHCKNSRDRDDSEVPPKSIVKKLEWVKRTKTLYLQSKYSSIVNYLVQLFLINVKINLDKANANVSQYSCVLPP